MCLSLQLHFQCGVNHYPPLEEDIPEPLLHHGHGASSCGGRAFLETAPAPGSLPLCQGVPHQCLLRSPSISAPQTAHPSHHALRDRTPKTPSCHTQWSPDTQPKPPGTHSLPNTRSVLQEWERYPFLLINRIKYRKSNKTRMQRNMCEKKEYDKTSPKELNDTELSNLLEFKLMIIKLLIRLERRVEQLSENLYRQKIQNRTNQT